MSGRAPVLTREHQLRLFASYERAKAAAVKALARQKRNRKHYVKRKEVDDA